MGVVSRRWMWVEFVGVVIECGCKEVYRFPHITYPYSSCICSFLQQHPYFLLNVFRSCYNYIALVEKCRGGTCAQEWCVHC